MFILQIAKKIIGTTTSTFIVSDKVGLVLIWWPDRNIRTTIKNHILSLLLKKNCGTVVFSFFLITWDVINTGM